VSNWVTGELTRLTREAPLKIEPGVLSEVLKRQAAGELTLPQAREVFAGAYASGETVAAIIERAGYSGATDADELRGVCEKVIAANPKVVADIKGGKAAALQVLVGQVMRETKGSANPDETRAVLTALLEL
jgi:aspartyl-tRNA(Asn)/glutamyl-tRNA(Gln) amidotransferase subunit B